MKIRYEYIGGKIRESDNHKLIFASPDADPRELMQYLCDAIERDTFYRPTVTE